MMPARQEFTSSRSAWPVGPTTIAAWTSGVKNRSQALAPLAVQACPVAGPAVADVASDRTVQTAATPPKEGLDFKTVLPWR